MIVCSCNVLSDHDVRSVAVDVHGAPQFPVQVHICLGCRPQCGRCAGAIRRILEDARGRHLGCGAAEGPMAAPSPSLTHAQRRLRA